jgi:hypothetical protein
MKLVTICRFAVPRSPKKLGFVRRTVLAERTGSKSESWTESYAEIFNSGFELCCYSLDVKGLRSSLGGGG